MELEESEAEVGKSSDQNAAVVEELEAKVRRLEKELGGVSHHNAGRDGTSGASDSSTTLALQQR